MSTPVPAGIDEREVGIRLAHHVGEAGVQDGWLAGQRGLWVHDGGKRLELDDDRVGGVAREIAVGSHDHGDGLAAVADGVGGHGIVGWRWERRANRHRPEELFHLGARVNGGHAGHGLRRARIELRILPWAMSLRLKAT